LEGIRGNEGLLEDWVDWRGFEGMAKKIGYRLTKIPKWKEEILINGDKPNIL